MKVKNCLAVFLCVALFASAAMGRAHAAGDGSVFAGQGTAQDPYCIENTQQMWALARLVNAGDAHYAGAHYRLSANIDLGPADWVPIGLDESHPFRGVFDGNGYGVATLRSWDKEQQADYAGFFGVTEGAVIDNLYVEGNIDGHIYKGQLVAWAKDSQIKNCAGKLHIGDGPTAPCARQLVGRSDNSRIENCAYYYLPYGCFLVGPIDDATRVVNSFSAGKANLYYHGDSSWTQVWAPGHEVSPEQSVIATSYSDFIRELNAWVDSQPQGAYRHWKVPDGAEEVITDSNGHPLSAPTIWPVLADYLVEVRMEAPGANQEEQAWFSQFNSARGYLAKEGIYAAQAGRPPRIIGLDSLDGFQLAEISMDGKVIGRELPAITEDTALTLSFVRGGRLSHFTMSHPDVEYPDVAANAWYGAQRENTVSDVTRLGFFVGRDNGRFAPEESLLLCEAVKLAAVVHSIYTGDNYPFDQTAGDHWFDTYMDYAVQAGILYDWEFGELTQPATRLQMANLFCRAIPQLELEGTPTDHQLSPSDIGGELERYQWSVRNLYWHGVLRGADQDGNFYPNRTITRAEAATILVRLVLPERRFVSATEI